MTVAVKQNLKVADEVWIAAALLHREHPDRNDFDVDEIVSRAREEAISGDLRPGVYVHWSSTVSRTDRRIPGIIECFLRRPRIDVALSTGRFLRSGA